MIRSIKKKLWIGLAILILLAAAGIFGFIRLQLDIAMILWALGGFVLAYSFYLIVSYILTPKSQVTITTKVELNAPPRLLKSVKNYRLKVSTEKHVEEKGKERTLKMDELIMSFNSADHPNAHDYCMRVISAHMDSCLRSAQEAHPNALVSGPQLSLPPELKLLDS